MTLFPLDFHGQILSIFHNWRSFLASQAPESASGLEILGDLPLKRSSPKPYPSAQPWPGGITYGVALFPWLIAKLGGNVTQWQALTEDWLHQTFRGMGGQVFQGHLGDPRSTLMVRVQTGWGLQVTVLDTTIAQALLQPLPPHPNVPDLSRTLEGDGFNRLYALDRCRHIRKLLQSQGYLPPLPPAECPKAVPPNSPLEWPVGSDALQDLGPSLPQFLAQPSTAPLLMTLVDGWERLMHNPHTLHTWPRRGLAAWWQFDRDQAWVGLGRSGCWPHLTWSLCLLANLEAFLEILGSSPSVTSTMENTLDLARSFKLGTWP